jgi:hypothetical protein
MVLYEDVAGTLVSRVTGLVRRVAMAEHGRRIFVTDGATHQEIDGTTVRPWGLPVPVITVAAGSGSALPAGRYLVQAAWVDAAGNSGGVSDLVAVTLDGTKGLTVSIAAPATDAAAVDIYASGANQIHTTWVARVAKGTSWASLPYALPATRTTIADPPVTEQHSGPHTGLIGLASWRAWLLGWKANALYRSEGLEPHLWYGEHFQPFRGDIRGVVPVLSGIWVATSDGLFWLTGEDFGSLAPSRRTSRPCRFGQGLVAGDWLPMLQTQGQVALFVDADGIMACTEAGMVVPEFK